MRLKTKILLCLCAFIIAAVMLCCILILRIVREQLQAKALEIAEKEFTEAINRTTQHVEPEEDATICDSYMIYWLRKSDIANELTLSSSEKYLVNNSGIAPERYVLSDDPETDYKVHTVCVRLNGRLYLIAGRALNYQDRTYRICLVRDLDSLDRDIREIAWKCVVIGAIVTVCFLVLTCLLLTLSLRPVKKLNDGAKAIAAGDYHTRIHVKRNDEIGRLSDAFNDMAEAVESSIESLREQNERKQQFINDLSHEMKTPVTSLLINSETLMTRHIGEQHASHIFTRIHEQAKWIERLSQKLMQLVILQDRIELTPSPVSALFDTVVDTTHDSLARAKMTLQVSCADEVIPMDLDLMRSALVNLIENAIKASVTGSTIELIAHENKIIVRDHGKGIPENEIERITEPFYMVDRSRSKKLGGSGLGLALVKRIAEAHHAELHIESEVDKGTSIFFRFSDAVL